ncbi:MAG: FtsB family cell division protein [Acidimicrobiales bacterium]
MIVLAVFVFGVFPTGQFVEQRDELDRATLELDALLAENRSLQEGVDGLQTDAAIERVAREQYDLVLPGEEVYAILPPAGS